jgi:hypothetical protein
VGRALCLADGYVLGLQSRRPEDSVLSRPPPLHDLILYPLLNRSRRRSQSLKPPPPEYQLGLRTQAKFYNTTKPAAGKTKKEAASVKTAAAEPTNPDLVVPTLSSTYPLEEISEFLDHLHIQARVELTRRLIMSISSLCTGAAHPRSVLKSVIIVVDENDSTP